MGNSIKSLTMFLDEWLERRSATGVVPGFVVAIYSGSSQIYNRGFGMANTQTGERMTSDYMFPVCSQSKMITATAIMQLVEAGKLKLTDKASKHLPQLAKNPHSSVNGVSIQQILWHGAGFIRDGQDADYWQLAREFPDRDELSDIVLASRPSSARHLRVKYSNIGYAILGNVIEAVTSQSYDDYCQKNIVKPLGVSSFSLYPKKGQKFATGYTRALAGKRLATPAYISTNALSASVGWHAKANDMAKFLSTHMADNNKLLTALSKHRMHQGIRHHWLPKSLRGVDYGLGFQTYKLGDIKMTGHGGTSVGHRSKTVHDYRTGLSIAVMANAKDAPILQIVVGIIEVCRYFFEHGNAPVPPNMKRFNVNLEGAMSTVQIVTIGKKVLTIFPDSWQPLAGSEELRYIGRDTFVVSKASDMAATGEPVRFVFDHQGCVQSVNYTGSTLLSERSYYGWLKKNLKKWRTQANPDILV